MAVAVPVATQKYSAPQWRNIRAVGCLIEEGDLLMSSQEPFSLVSPTIDLDENYFVPDGIYT
jgi:hypothetical protein